MKRTVKARFANGVLTPMEPLELDENNLVLVTIEEISAPHAPGVEATRPPFRVKPVPGGFAPGVDQAKLKGLLSEMDDEEFLRKLNL